MTSTVYSFNPKNGEWTFRKPKIDFEKSIGDWTHKVGIGIQKHTICEISDGYCSTKVPHKILYGPDK